LIKALKALENAPAGQLYALRLKIRAQIQQLVRAITLHTYGTVTKRLAIARVELANGLVKMFVVRRERYRDTVSIGTTWPLQSLRFNPERLANRLIDCMGLTEHAG
jgi:hypothetical protein